MSDILWFQKFCPCYWGRRFSFLFWKKSDFINFFRNFNAPPHAATGGKNDSKSCLKSILILAKFLFQVSDDLEAIIGVSEASRAQCIKHLWAYLKEKNLQNTDKRFFTPDKKMARTASEASVCPSILAHTFLTSTIEKYV